MTSLGVCRPCHIRYQYQVHKLKDYSKPNMHTLAKATKKTAQTIIPNKNAQSLARGAGEGINFET